MKRGQRTLSVPAIDYKGAVWNFRICVAPRRKHWELWLECQEWDAHLYPDALNVLRRHGELFKLMDAHGYSKQAIFGPIGTSKKAEVCGGGYWLNARGLTEAGAMALAECLRSVFLFVASEIDVDKCYPVTLDEDDAMHDSDGVPLCAPCMKELSEDAANRDAPW